MGKSAGKELQQEELPKTASKQFAIAWFISSSMHKSGLENKQNKLHDEDSKKQRDLKIKTNTFLLWPLFSTALSE